MHGFLPGEPLGSCAADECSFLILNEADPKRSARSATVGVDRSGSRQGFRSVRVLPSKPAETLGAFRDERAVPLEINRYFLYNDAQVSIR